MTKAEKYVRAHLMSELEEVQQSPIAAVANGLTVYEKTLIYHYTKDGYREINRELRTHADPPPEIAGLLARALHKLPYHRDVVHRTAHLTQRQIQGYRTALRSGEPVTEVAFTSASLSPLIGRLMPAFNVKYQIISKAGKLIEDCSYMGKHTTTNEREVLFSANSEFSVLSVTQQGRYVLIRMEEL